MPKLPQPPISPQELARQLQRQIGSLLYERTGLSTDKQAVIETGRQQAVDAPRIIADLIRS